MAIYKYTMQKYLKSFSTWVILIIAAIITFCLGSWLPFALLDTNAANASVTYQLTILSVVSGVTTIAGLFTAVYAGFKGAQLYKDEVEDGTFLIVLSKPQSRSKIIFEKWLALLTMAALYIILNVSLWIMGIYLFDNGSQIVGMPVTTLKSHVWIAAMWIAITLSVLLLIFSSLAVLISTRTSTGATIGISIAIAVVVPITNLISVFTHKKTHDILSKETSFPSGFVVGPSFQNHDSVSNIKNSQANSIDPLVLLAEILATIPGVAGELSASSSEIYKDTSTIAGVSLRNGLRDSFNNAWFIDLNYQLSLLGSFATDSIITEEQRQFLETSDTTERFYGTTSKQKVIAKTDNIQKLIDRLKATWKITDTISNEKDIKNFITLANELTSTGGKPWYEWITDIELREAAKELDQIVVQNREGSLQALLIKESVINSETPKSSIKTELLNAVGETAIIEVLKKIGIPEDFINNDFIPHSEIKVGPSPTPIQLKDANEILDEELRTLGYLAINAQANNLDVIRTVPYVNKNILLYVYSGIAILLVPIAYLVVRRQDFR